jgi:FKBP-type peptidyl-prolyl cis-trans isomerase SlyD
MKIATGTVVSIRYIMTNNQGEVLENTMDKNAVDYLQGAGKILPALEACLHGMEPGQRQKISVAAANHADLNEDFHFDIIIDAVRPASPEELSTGKPIHSVVKNNCGPEGCC